MKPNAGRWCLITDSLKARLFRIEETGKLVPLATIHAQSIEEFELTNPGRGMHHEHDRKNPRTARLAKDFSKKISAYLEQALKQGRFDRLVIAAEPSFLGLLREILPPTVKRAIETEIPKSYRGPAEAIEKQLSQNLGL